MAKSSAGPALEQLLLGWKALLVAQSSVSSPNPAPLRQIQRLFGKSSASSPKPAPLRLIPRWPRAGTASQPQKVVNNSSSSPDKQLENYPPALQVTFPVAKSDPPAVFFA
jgi:hypothetical protein